jgi:hypothetical protein
MKVIIESNASGKPLQFESVEACAIDSNIFPNPYNSAGLRLHSGRLCKLAMAWVFGPSLARNGPTTDPNISLQPGKPCKATRSANMQIRCSNSLHEARQASGPSRPKKAATKPPSRQPKSFGKPPSRQAAKPSAKKPSHMIWQAAKPPSLPPKSQPT